MPRITHKNPAAPIAKVEPKAALLNWYDSAKRTLPWRKRKPNPYHVWLSEIMLQQTGVSTVIPYFKKFITLWPNLKNLAEAEERDVLAAWSGLGYYARARNLLRCARQVQTDWGGQFPQTAEKLQTLLGIGEYASAAIAAIAFGQPIAAIDGNVRRLMGRLKGEREIIKMPSRRQRILQQAAALKWIDAQRPGDSVQALMEMGALVCRPHNPKCASCPLLNFCKTGQRSPENPMVKNKKAESKPIRQVKAFLLQDETQKIWLIRRPPSGLLGGMLAPPLQGLEKVTTPLTDRLEKIEWQSQNTEIRHVFTHFTAYIDIYMARLPKNKKKRHTILTELKNCGDLRDGAFYNPLALQTEPVPSLVRKLLASIVST